MEVTQRLSSKMIFGLGSIALVAIFGLVLVFAAAFCTTPAALAQSQGGDTAINHDKVIDTDETVDGDVNVTNGNLIVRGEVDGKAVVVNGSATIEGKVTSDVSALVAGSVTLGKGAEVGGDILANGDIVLGPGSKVAGDVHAVGGKVIRDPLATVSGQITAAGISLDGTANQVVVTPAPPFSEPVTAVGEAPSSVIDPARAFANKMLALFAQGLVAVVLLALGALMVVLVPHRVRLSSATLETEPGPSIIVGFIAGALLFPIVGVVGVVLTISVIGLPFLPVLAIAVLLLLLYGLVTLSSLLGHWVFTSAGYGAGPTPTTHVAQVLTGMAIILGTTIVPSAVKPGLISVIMAVVLYFATCAGVGAVLLSRFGTLAPPKHAPVYFHNPFGAPGRGPAPANSHFVADPRHAATPHAPASPLPPEEHTAGTRH
jgi:cytoskeletal protein CcmA (bactofilin family)